jgi:thiol-disulfide isomerase/thioredoxin
MIMKSFSFSRSAMVLPLMLAASVASAIEVGQILPPDLKIEAVQSGAIQRETIEGKVTILNFWATWCAACKVEIKEMEAEFANLMKNERFQLAFVSLDKDPNMAVQWFKENTQQPAGMLERLYKDPEFSAAERLSVDSFPMTVVVGPDGKVLHIQKGFEEGKGLTEKMVKLSEAVLTTP